MKNTQFKLLNLTVAILATSVMFTACGGGSSSSSDVNLGNNNPPISGGGTTPPTSGGDTPPVSGGDSDPYTGDVKCKASNVSYRNGLYDDTYVVKASMPNSSKKIDPNDPNIIDTCGFGTVCYEDDFDGEGHVKRNGGKAFCASSMLDQDSPYKDFGSDLGFTEFMRYPTKLEVDCRSRFRSVIASQAVGGTGNKPADPAKHGVHPNGAIMNCAQPDSLDRVKWPVPYGDGPVFSHFNRGAKVWYGAEFNPETRELIAVVKWNNSSHVNTTTIVAWNVDTKNRRIISGIFPHTDGDQIFGSGYESPLNFHNNTSGGKQPMTGVDSIRLAKDGYLYVSSNNEIIKVDQQTGKRELIWRKQVQSETGDISNTYGQCYRPSYLGDKNSLQLEGVSFTVADNGKYYKGFRDAKGGSGVIELSSDAKTCTVIARYNGKGDPAPKGSNSVPAPADVGTGFKPNLLTAQIRGMLVHDGKLYYANSKALVSLDLNSKVRKRVDDGLLPYSPGYTSMYYDPNRKVIWTSGSSGAVFGNVIVNPISGQKEYIATENARDKYGDDNVVLRTVHPQIISATRRGALNNGHVTQMGGVIVDPKKPDFAYGVSNQGALLQLELSTYNNMVYSWGQDF